MNSDAMRNKICAYFLTDSPSFQSRAELTNFIGWIVRQLYRDLAIVAFTRDEVQGIMRSDHTLTDIEWDTIKRNIVSILGDDNDNIKLIVDQTLERRNRK